MQNAMAVIKVEISIPEAVKALKKFKEHRSQALEEVSKSIKDSVKTAMNDLTNAEMNLYLGEPDQADNTRNDYKIKTYTFKGIGTLELELTDPGFDFSVLSEFRSRLIDGGAEERLLDILALYSSKQGIKRSLKGRVYQ